MQRIALVTVIAAMLPLSAFASDLTTIQSIYIDASPRERLEIVRILRSELPELRVADRRSKADAVLDFRFELSGSPARRPRTQQEGRPTVTYAMAPGGRRIVTRGTPSFPEDGDPTPTARTISNVFCVLRVRATGEEIVVHSGRSLSFTEQAAKKLVALLTASRQATRTISVIGSVRDQVEIGDIIRKALPHLGFAARPEKADLILEIRRGAPGSTLDFELPKQVSPSTSVPNDGVVIATRSVAKAVGVVSGPGDQSVELHTGIDSPFFASQFAWRFVETYRGANLKR